MTDQRTRHRIKSLKVDEVSLVDRPANAAARFILAKRDVIEKDDELDLLDIELAELEAELESEISAEDDSEDDADNTDDIEAELDQLDMELANEDDEDDIDDDMSEDDSEDEDSDEDESEDEDDESDEADGEDGDLEKLDKAYTTFAGASARTNIWPMVEALRESLASIVNDPESDAVTKQAAVKLSVSQFAAEADRLVGTVDTTDEGSESVGKINKSIKGTNMGRETLEKRVTELHDANTALTKRLSDFEEKEQIRDLTDEARSILGKSAKADDVTEMVALLKTAPAEQKAFIKKMAARTAVLEKDSKLFAELGSSASGSLGKSDTAEQLAEELRKANPKLTRPQAIAKAYEQLGDDAYVQDNE